MYSHQLVPFGKAMKAFADEVTGLDASVITEAATAGKAIYQPICTVFEYWQNHHDKFHFRSEIK